MAPEGPVIVVGNHLSYLDPFAHALFVVHAARRPRFLAKQELFEIPVVGTVLRGAGQIPVRRGTGDQSPLLDAAAALDRGEVVVVYPEGTTASTNADFAPGRGKTGAVRLSLMTGLPILPVATWGGQYVWRKSGRQSMRFGRPILVEAGDPVDVASRISGEPDGAGLRAQTDLLMQELARGVERLRVRYPSRWTPR